MPVNEKIIQSSPKLKLKLIENPKKLSFIQTNYQLFLTALLQVTFVAMNTVFISRGYIMCMLLTAFMISLIWTINIKRVAFGGWTDRFVYATGAMFGTGFGYLIAINIIKHI